MRPDNRQKYTVAVLGGGSFGTALANIVATNGHTTYLWFRNEERAAQTQESRENARYLPGYTLHENLSVTADLALALREADAVVIAVPSHSYREVVKTAREFIHPGAIVISGTKGIESPNFTLMSQILEEELDDVHVGVLSGPNFAKEIIRNQQTGSVIASESEKVLEVIPHLFSSPSFRIYTNHDRYGVELAGALKNIYAIITGMACALGCGNNTQAMILTRSLAEMGRFANELGANAMTFLGLAGVGDLFLTCSSDLSRNYRVGYAIGSGKSLDQAMEEVGQVAEGVSTLSIVKKKVDELGVYMPLVSGLYAVLFENVAISAVAEQLMTGEMTSDVEFHS